METSKTEETREEVQTVNVPTGNVTINLSLDAGEARRFNRIFLNASEGGLLISGPRTDRFAKAVVAELGIDADNSRKQ